jgi:hypothetical protein
MTGDKVAEFITAHKADFESIRDGAKVRNAKIEDPSNNIPQTISLKWYSSNKNYIPQMIFLKVYNIPQIISLKY